MKKVSNYELGHVQIHNNVIEQIVQTALTEIEGVSLAPKHLGNQLLEYFGKSGHSSIDVKVNEKEEVSLDVKIRVRYGMHLPDVARQVQEVIKQAVEKAVDIHLTQINVNIQGIERGPQ